MKSNILNTQSVEIQNIITQIIKPEMSKVQKIKACYDYVQNEIKFGYNEDDKIKASDVVKDGYGQCNTKATLLMTLLKATGIKSRFHGFKIDKRLQYGAITGIFYIIAPKKIIHSWVEVELEQGWVNLEGFILDKEYLKSLQSYFSSSRESLCGYGVASNDFQKPQIDFNLSESTYIQKEGIIEDLGVYDSPDEFYKLYGTNLSGLKKFFYKYFIRHLMNRNIARIRDQKEKGGLKTLCETKDLETIEFKI